MSLLCSKFQWPLPHSQQKSKSSQGPARPQSTLIPFHTLSATAPHPPLSAPATLVSFCSLKILDMVPPQCFAHAGPSAWNALPRYLQGFIQMSSQGHSPHSHMTVTPSLPFPASCNSPYLLIYCVFHWGFLPVVCLPPLAYKLQKGRDFLSTSSTAVPPALRTTLASTSCSRKRFAELMGFLISRGKRTAWVFAALGFMHYKCDTW